MSTTLPVDSPLRGESSNRRPDIQGLRAIAVLVVVAFHATLPLRGGFVGVDIFFVISGFVITALILRQVAQQTFRFGTFYARRAKRLMPALALMVLLVLIASLLLESPFGPQEVTAKTGIGAMLLSANIVILRTVGGYFDAAAVANPLLHTWSLSVEEQFYLGFPLLIWLTARRSRAWLVGGVIALTALSFASSTWLSFGHSPLGLTSQPESWAFYLSTARAWEFGVGALLAIWVARRQGAGAAAVRRPVGGTAMAVVGLVLVIVAVLWIDESMAFPGLVALIPVVGTGLLLVAGLTPGNPVSRLLATRPMVRVGDWSYSIYLWHWPVILFATLVWPRPWTPVIAAAVSFAPAIASYHWFEEPVRSLPVDHPGKIGAAAVATAGIVIAVALGVIAIGPRLVPFSDGRTVGADIPAGCLLLDTAYAPSMADACWHRVAEPKGWILLTGDSHANSVSAGAIAAGNTLGYDVLALTAGDCPVVRGTQANARITNCAAMIGDLLDLAEGKSGPAASAVVMAHRGLPAGVDTTLQELATTGVPVVYVREVPQWRGYWDKVGPDPCSGGWLNFTCVQSRDEVAARTAEVRANETTTLAEIPGVTLVDPWPVFCTADTCSPLLDGQLAYTDAGHLNPLGGRAMAADIQSALSSAIGSASK